MPKLKLLTFDLMGTILKTSEPVGETYAYMAQKAGLRVEPSLLEERFKKHFKALSKERPNFGKGDCGWENWWEELIKKTYQLDKESNYALKQVTEDLIKYYSTPEAYCLADEDAMDVLCYLKRKQICVGAITNTDPRINHIMWKKVDIRKYFHFMLVSYDFGIAKPDRRIFEEAENQYLKLRKVRPGKKLSLHLGDNPVEDYLGATGTGWHGALIAKNADKIICEHPEVSSSMIVPNMAEFLNFLKDFEVS